MKKNILLLMSISLSCFAPGDTKICARFDDQEEEVMQESNYAIKGQLNNGMTVLVRPVHAIPKVSVQLWYNVGSKDEKTGEKGIAHAIEHMVFKGTEGKNSLNLSESDINLVTHTLSGTCNAFTAHDYTGYLFNFPVHTWQHALPIMADCMQNAAFKDDHLDSEMKAIVQELKMRRDNNVLSLLEAMITNMFSEHPYHYPIIGYKQDLWAMHGKNLRSFYKKHYVPNNATLVVVGDVNADEVFELAEKYFGSIPANPHYAKELFYINPDIVSKGVTLYRDVKQPVVVLGFLAPGLMEKKSHVLEIISWLLGQGKSSRLYKKIVDELHLATSMQTFTYDFFEHSIFFIIFEPQKMQDVDKIIEIIQKEIAQLAKQGPTDAEITRALKKARMQHYTTLENTQEQAYEIGKYFLATGDENYVAIFSQDEIPGLKEDIKEILHLFRPSIMHKGMVVPLPESEIATWEALQQKSDELDAEIVSARERTTPLEQPNYVKKIKPDMPRAFDFPKAEADRLTNGMKIYCYNNDNIPKIDIVIELAAKPYSDPEDKQGLYTFVAEMLTEGTENYTAAEFAHELESRGMALSVTPGTIAMSMLSTDLEKGLELLKEILMYATFDEKEIEKVRAQLLTAIKNFWDEPKSFVGQLIKEKIYKGHPYSKNSLGTEKAVQAITRQDLINFYKENFTPVGTTLAIVGDLKNYDVPEVLEKTIGSWKGSALEPIEFPKLVSQKATEINYPIKRDQVVLSFVGLSVDRKDKDYDKLLIFDQILGGGVLGSMNSRLFKLREQSGLFYTISGSLTSGANEQPGMIVVRTIVSMDRLKEAEEAIKNTLKTAADSITEQEFQEAKDAIINSLILRFESNLSIAQVFLFLDKFGFPADYFDKRISDFAKISIKDVQQAVKKVLNTDMLTTFRVGRVPAK